MLLKPHLFPICSLNHKVTEDGMQNAQAQKPPRNGRFLFPPRGGGSPHTGGQNPMANQTNYYCNRMACFGPVASLGKQQHLIIYVSETGKVHHLGMTLYIKHHLWRLAEWSQGCKTLATK